MEPTPSIRRPIDSFDLRAEKYTKERIARFNEALELVPNAREVERQLVINQLALESGQTICDVGAGGGYLSDGIFSRLRGDCDIVCVENSQHFLDSVSDAYTKVLSSLNSIDLSDGSADRVASLAGLHHLEAKADFFCEAFRILKPGGRLVVADVELDSGPARFLNGPVDRYTDIGHDGMFLAKGDLSRFCAEAGFERAGEMTSHYSWEFPNYDAMVRYCQSLFRMTSASLEEVGEAIKECLEFHAVGDRVLLSWSLVSIWADRG